MRSRHVPHGWSCRTLSSGLSGEFERRSWRLRRRGGRVATNTMLPSTLLRFLPRYPGQWNGAVVTGILSMKSPPSMERNWSPQGKSKFLERLQSLASLFLLWPNGPRGPLLDTTPPKPTALPKDLRKQTPTWGFRSPQPCAIAGLGVSFCCSFAFLSFSGMLGVVNVMGGGAGKVVMLMFCCLFPFSFFFR